MNVKANSEAVQKLTVTKKFLLYFENMRYVLIKRDRVH